MQMSRYFRALALAVIALIGFSASSYATSLRLRIEDVGTGIGVVITDNGVGDLNSGIGAITVPNVTFGVVTLNIVTGLSKPVIGTGTAELDLNSVNVQTTGAGTLRITLEDTDFSSPQFVLFFDLIGRVVGTLTAPAGSSATFNTWVNPADLVPTLGPDTFPPAALAALGAIPAGSIAAFGSGFSSGPGGFSATGVTSFTPSGPYSLFSQATIVFTGAGSASFDSDSKVAPKPSSLFLLAMGMLGVVAWGRRQDAKNLWID